MGPARNPQVSRLSAATQDPQQARTALVTGGSSGIGVAIATELARRGHALMLVALRAERLSEVATRLSRDHGIRVDWLAANLAHAEERDRVVSEIAARGLVVDLLINNAGIGTMGSFHDLPVGREVELVRLNIEAVVALCGAFVPGMVARGRGRILNVASTLAFMPVPRQAVYSASKAFVLTFTEALTMDLHGTGVTATALCPGPVKTEFAGLIEGSPSALFIDAHRVAREAIDGLERGRRMVIPGATNAVGAVLSRHIPRGLFLSLARRFWPA
jgi:uncharacterized protein